MKLRSLVFLSAVAAGTLGAATLESTNVLGLMKVDTNTTYTVIAVPWVKVDGANDAAVNVADLVKTDGLTPKTIDQEGDKLFVYEEDGTYKCWELTESGGNVVWTPMTTVSEVGVTVAAGAADASIPRGKALWIKRSNTSKANPIYLYGQYSPTAVSCTIKNGFNLIANPNGSDFDLNNGKIVGGGNDQIHVMGENGVARIYTYSATDNTWGYQKITLVKFLGKDIEKAERCVDDCKIPAGTGCWYIRKGTDFTFNW